MTHPRPPAHRTILVVDVEGFGNRFRTNQNQVAVRAGLYRVLEQAFNEAGISLVDCSQEDRGDGVFILARPEISKVLFVELLPYALVKALGEHNAQHPPEERIRLRMALHAGEVNYDNYGATGASINLTFRLLDAGPLKAALATSPGVLALIASSWFFDEVVRHSQDSRPATYRRITVVVKETTVEGWICLPDHPFSGEYGEYTVGPVFAVPPLRGDEVVRPGLMEELVAAVTRPAATAVGRTVALWGGRGFGKTTMARLLVHRGDVRKRFPDGVVWVTAGENVTESEMAEKITTAVGKLGGQQRRTTDPLTAGVGLGRALGERRMLLVVDDVWSAAQVEPFLIGGSAVVRLFTTRMRTALPDSTELVQVNEMTPDEARHLVTAGAREVSAGVVPLSHQRLVAAVMRALYASGKPHEALALYQAAYEQIVKNEGLEIEPEMMQVQLGILRGDLDVQVPQHHARTISRGQAPCTPLMVGNLPPRADSFQDRAASQTLHRTAGPGQTTVLTQVVAGLGGVGKTQLAAEFARQLWGAGELDLMVWVSALSRDSVVSGYVQAGADLALGPENEEPERTAARLLAWLANTQQRWLIILDDLAGPADIRDLWPPDRPNGRTVVTTRRRDADLLAGRNLVEVSVFTETEAVEYVSRKLQARPHLADDVLGVVTDLDALPLALSHATAYMIDLDLPCSGYRARFSDRRRRLAELFPHPDTLYEGNSRTVSTTWTLSIEAADRLPPIGIARPLLAIVSALNPNGIPEEVLAAPTAQEYLASRLPRRPDWADIRDGLRGLHRFHLVTHESGMIRIHALVQRAVREDLGELQSTAVARASADALLEIWPAADNDTGQLLRANAMALQDNWPAAIWDPAQGIHPVMMRTIESLGIAVQLSEAIRLCRQLSQQAVEYFGPRHPDTLALRNQLATWLGDAGQTQEAITSLGGLISDVATALGRDHPMAIAARQNLGYQWGQAGYPAKAVAELTIVLGDQVRVLGPDDPAVLTTRNHLVYWRAKAGDTTDAVAELEALVQLATRIHGAEHRETLELRGALASFRADTVGYAQSAIEMREVLDDMRRALGPGHRDVSVLRLNLAERQRQAGDLATAAAALQELLTERIKSHGPYHRDTVATRHALSKVFTDLQDFAGAAAELEEVIEGMRRLAGPKHLDTLHRRYELACVHERMGRHLQAADSLKDVLADQLAVLGTDSHKAVTATQEALARFSRHRESHITMLHSGSSPTTTPAE